MSNEIDLKKLRQHRNWTQEKMGEHFGVDKATVWRWENEGIPERGVARKAIEREWETVRVEVIGLASEAPKRKRRAAQ